MSSEPSKGLSSELFNYLGAEHIHETDDCNLCTMSKVMKPIIEIEMRNKIIKQIVDYYIDTRLTKEEEAVWKNCIKIAHGSL